MAPSPPGCTVTKPSSLLAASVPGTPAPALQSSHSCHVSKQQPQRAPVHPARGSLVPHAEKFGNVAREPHPFPDLSSPGCQPQCPPWLSGHVALPVLVPTTVGIPGRGPGAGPSPFTDVPAAATQADATTSIQARTRGACPRCRLTCHLCSRPHVTMPGQDAAPTRPSQLPSATLCLREPTAAPPAPERSYPQGTDPQGPGDARGFPGPQPGAALPAGTAGAGFGDAASPVNAAAAYDAGGATVLRQSPAVSSLRASSAPAPSVPPTHGSPSPHGSSLTHGASWECGSEAGMRAGDMHRSSAGTCPMAPTPERLGNTEPE